MKTTPTFLLFAWLAAIPAAAQESREAESRPARPLSQSIADLDAEDFHRREVAMVEILAAGDDARAALEETREQGSLERRLRIGELLGRLGTKSAASRPAPLKKTLDLRGKNLREACEALGSAFGLRIRAATGADGGLSVDLLLEDATFFPALDAVCAAASATFYRDARDGAFVLRASPDKPAPVVYADGLRVSLIQLSVTRSKRFGAASTSSSYLQVQLDVDPTAPAVGVMAPMSLGAAEDDQGRSLLPKERQLANYVQRFDPTGRLPCSSQIIAPEADAKQIKLLRFDFKVVVPERTAEVEIASPREDPDNPRGDGPLRVTVEEWRETEAGISVKLSLDRPQSQGEGPEKAAVYDDQVVFTTTEGAVVEPRTSGTRNAIGKSQYEAQLPKGEYASLRVTTLVKYAVRDVTATFRDVPLP